MWVEYNKTYFKCIAKFLTRRRKFVGTRNKTEPEN